MLGTRYIFPWFCFNKLDENEIYQNHDQGSCSSFLLLLLYKTRVYHVVQTIDDQ
jgi:hypothetical protein